MDNSVHIKPTAVSGLREGRSIDRDGTRELLKAKEAKGQTLLL